MFLSLNIRLELTVGHREIHKKTITSILMTKHFSWSHDKHLIKDHNYSDLAVKVVGQSQAGIKTNPD